jgi:hypothetical protein
MADAIDVMQLMNGLATCAEIRLERRESDTKRSAGEDIASPSAVRGGISREPAVGGVNGD